jgi:solute carrier family 10 (sodium/bile acid cotransporter), member 7
MRRFLPDPFLLLLIATVVAATLLPAQGTVATAMGAAATAAIVLLFFLHGVRLPRDALVAALSHWRLHATILSCTYLLVPLLGLALRFAVPDLLPPALWVGVLFLCALPSTVQSSIAMVSIGKGNIGGAVASAAASNILGIVLTPLIVGALLQAKGGAVSFSGVWKIVLQLLLPFALGHLLRPWLREWATRRKAILTYTDRATIVLAIYSAFSAAVVAGVWQQVPLPRLAVLALLCAALLAVVLWLTRAIARRAGFSREDEVSIVMCGTQKSLVSGVPMARVLFAGPEVGLTLLPMMIYHQLQLMVCAVVARRYGERAAQAVEDT